MKNLDSQTEAMRNLDVTDPNELLLLEFLAIQWLQVATDGESGHVDDMSRRTGTILGRVINWPALVGNKRFQAILAHMKEKQAAGSFARTIIGQIGMLSRQK